MLHHEAKATWTFFNKPMLPCFVVFFSYNFISFIRSPKSMDRTQSGSDVKFCVTFTHFSIDRNFTFMCVNENWQLVNLIRIVGIDYWKIHLFTMKFKPSMTLSKWRKIDFPSFSLLFWNDQNWNNGRKISKLFAISEWFYPFFITIFMFILMEFFCLSKIENNWMEITSQSCCKMEHIFAQIFFTPKFVEIVRKITKITERQKIPAQFIHWFKFFRTFYSITIVIAFRISVPWPCLRFL